MRRRSATLLVWAVVFFYLFVDDAFRLHEEIGGDAMGARFAEWFGKRIDAKDLGELVYSVIAGLVILSAVGIAYRFAQPWERRESHAMVLLLGILAVFGILVDTLPDLLGVYLSKRIKHPLEEGGEHIVMSMLLWYVISMIRRPALAHAKAA